MLIPTYPVYLQSHLLTPCQFHSSYIPCKRHTIQNTSETPKRPPSYPSFYTQQQPMQPISTKLDFTQYKYKLVRQMVQQQRIC
jgi:hypothetical protein